MAEGRAANPCTLTILRGRDRELAAEDLEAGEAFALLNERARIAPARIGEVALSQVDNSFW
jgi:hypothetical protein